MPLIENLKDWLRNRGGRAHHLQDLSHLAPPKTPAGQHLSDLRMIVLDLETTGLNPLRDQVIAIGAVAIDNLTIPLDDQFDLILRRPELDIRETVLIHGIGQEALIKGHETEDALLHLLEWMNGDPVLAFHSAFDRKFLERALKHHLGYTRSHTWLDVADLLPAVFPNALEGSFRLDNWAEHFDLQISARHHAAADAMATAELSLIAFHRAIQQNITTLEGIHQKLRLYRHLRTMRRL